METISSTNARNHWSATAHKARLEPVLVTDHDRPDVIILDAELGRRLLEMYEDMEDSMVGGAVLDALEDGSETLMSWSDAEAEWDRTGA